VAKISDILNFATE